MGNKTVSLICPSAHLPTCPPDISPVLIPSSLVILPPVHAYFRKFDDQEEAHKDEQNDIILLIQHILKQLIGQMTVNIQSHFNNDQAGNQKGRLFFKSQDILIAGIEVYMLEDVIGKLFSDTKDRWNRK